MEGVLGLPVPPSSPSLGPHARASASTPLTHVLLRPPGLSLPLLPCTHWWQHLGVGLDPEKAQVPSLHSQPHLLCDLEHAVQLL